MMTVDELKKAVLKIEAEAKVVRFMSTNYRTLGLILEGTKDGFYEWEKAVESLGCHPEIHDVQQTAAAYPPSHRYSVTIYL